MSDMGIVHGQLKDIDLEETKSLLNSYTNPHYQALQFNTEDITSTFGLEKNFYEQELQNSLLKFESHKMPITVNWLCYNDSPKFKNNGGSISMGVGDSCYSQAVKNKKIFGKLKSLSVYAKYIFDTVRGGDILGVYGDLYYHVKDVSEVKTYTIVYIVAPNAFREVTLHVFGEFSNILTSLDLILE